MGEYILRGLAEKQGVEIEVCSAGTGDWHIGEGAHPKSVQVLGEIGYDAKGHKAQQFTSEWFDNHDLVLVMDNQNLRAVRALANTDSDEKKIRLFRSFDSEAGEGAEVADPYGFPVEMYREVRDQVLSASNGLLKHILAQR